MALVGLGAQLVDGSLGMAYGVTSTTLLLAIGTNPAAASATVHLAEIGTTLVSGAAHWRFGNVDWKVVVKIGVPGRGRRLRRRHVPLRPLHRDRRAADGAHPARARPLRPGPLHRLRACPRDKLGQAAAQALPRARSASSPASSTPPVAAAGARSARRRSWPAAGSSRARRSARSTPASSWSRSRPASASSSASAPRASTSPGWAPCSSAASSPRRSPPGWSGTSRRGCSARPSAASSSSPTPARCCAATGSTRPTRSATPSTRVIYVLWAAALAYSIRQYRANRAEGSVATAA